MEGKMFVFCIKTSNTLNMNTFNHIGIVITRLFFQTNEKLFLSSFFFVVILRIYNVGGGRKEAYNDRRRQSR